MTDQNRATPRHVETEADAFRRWEANAFAEEQASESYAEDDPRFQMSWAKAADYEALILQTPAYSREAILVKARLGRRDRNRDGDPSGESLFAQIIDYLAPDDERERQTRFV